MGFFEKLSKGLSKTKNSLLTGIEELFSSGADLDEICDELEELLIMADVGVKSAGMITDELRTRAKEQKLKTKEELFDAVKEIIADMMTPDAPMDLSGKPAVLLVIGVNGVGKTTSIGKMAKVYMRQGKKVLLAAADTFRAAAIDQLAVWADRNGCQIVKHEEGSDPAAVVFDAITAAKARNVDLVICDTAGRLHNKKNLMEELKKIVRVIKRESENSTVETLLVIDATTGQNAVNQARLFKEAADITGIVLTKLDGTAKGGVVIAIKNELDIPVRFVGVGEGIDDLEPFDGAQFAAALFDKEEKE